jgi:hypothetical protein
MRRAWHSRTITGRRRSKRTSSLLRVVVGEMGGGGAAGSVGVLGAAAVVEPGGVGRVPVLKLVVPAPSAPWLRVSSIDGSFD